MQRNERLLDIFEKVKAANIVEIPLCEEGEDPNAYVKLGKWPTEFVQPQDYSKIKLVIYNKVPTYILSELYNFGDTVDRLGDADIVVTPHILNVLSSLKRIKFVYKNDDEPFCLKNYCVTKDGNLVHKNNVKSGVIINTNKAACPTSRVKEWLLVDKATRLVAPLSSYDANWTNLVRFDGVVSKYFKSARKKPDLTSGQPQKRTNKRLADLNSQTSAATTTTSQMPIFELPCYPSESDSVELNFLLDENETNLLAQTGIVWDAPQQNATVAETPNNNLSISEEINKENDFSFYNPIEFSPAEDALLSFSYYRNINNSMFFNNSRQPTVSGVRQLLIMPPTPKNSGGGKV